MTAARFALSILLAAILASIAVPAGALDPGSAGSLRVQVGIIENPDPIGAVVSVSVLTEGSDPAYKILEITEGPDPIPQVFVSVQVGIIEGPDPIPQVSVAVESKIIEGPDPIPQVAVAVHVGITEGPDPIPQVTVLVSITDGADPVPAKT